MKVCRTMSALEVSGVMCDPVILDVTSDDGTETENWYPDMDAAMWLGIYDENYLIGVAVLHKINTATWQIHVSFRPTVWGTDATKVAGPLIVAEAFRMTCAKKLYAYIPTYCKQVVKYAKSLGFEIEGTSKGSWLKKGQLHDAYHMGVSK